MSDSKKINKIVITLKIKSAFVLFIVTISLRPVLAQVNNQDSIYKLLIQKSKIKSTTVKGYKSNDSSFVNLDFVSKTNTTYNSNGLELLTQWENDKGLIFRKTENKYDDKGRFVLFTEYDSSYFVMLNTQEYFYKNNDREIDEYYTSTEYNYDEKGNKSNIKSRLRITKQKLDLTGNLIEQIDSIQGTVSTFKFKYDNMNRRIQTEFYYGSVINYIETTNYNSKGERVVTKDYLQKSENTSYLPGQNRNIKKYDNNGNILSEISSYEINGLLTTTSTSYEYRFNKQDKLIEVITKKDSKEPNSSSTTVDKSTYKYDNKGNIIQTSRQQAGPNSTLTTIKYKYDTKNNMIENVTYKDTFSNYPESIKTYIYHEDGKTIKEESEKTSRYNSVLKYDTRGLKIEAIHIDYYDSCSKTIYSYEYW